MNKEFIPYEQALELKELGFDDYNIAWYAIVDEKPKIVFSNYGSHLCAPLYQQAFRWFREKKMLAEIKAVEDWNTWGFRIFEEDCMSPFYMSYYDYDVNDYNSYEEAEVACLKKLIEIAKNK